MRNSPTHYALGDSFDSACGVRYMLHRRGVKFVRLESQVTCRNCLRWLASVATGSQD